MWTTSLSFVGTINVASPLAQDILRRYDNAMNESQYAKYLYRVYWAFHQASNETYGVNRAYSEELERLAHYYFQRYMNAE